MEKYLFTGILIASLLSIMDYRTPLPKQNLAISTRKPSLGHQIKMTRIQKGYSHKYLARVTGLKYQDLVSIENGDAVPTLEMLYKIQETLGGALVVDGDALARK